MNDTLLYLVFGNKGEYQLELTYSVLSAVHFTRSREIRIALVCDPANCRPDLPVEHLVVSDEKVSGWTARYVYAAKAQALALGLRHYGGSVALVDTDTAFRRHPAELFRRVGPGRSVMQAEDGRLGDHAYWRDLLDAMRGPVEGYDVSARSRMMNSGVVALHESDSDAIPAALRLMSALHAIHPVFNIEQFAFTAALEERGSLVACDDVVWHYWGHARRFAHAQIGALFPVFDAQTFARNLDAPPPIGMPPISALVRARARVLQVLRRCDDDYRFAYIASLCAVGDRDSDWAQVTLDVLEAMERLPAEVARDFRAFRCQPASKRGSDSISVHSWIPTAAL